jgi:hypothetical protein
MAFTSLCLYFGRVIRRKSDTFANFFLLSDHCKHSFDAEKVVAKREYYRERPSFIFRYELIHISSNLIVNFLR